MQLVSSCIEVQVDTNDSNASSCVPLPTYFSQWMKNGLVLVGLHACSLATLADLGRMGSVVVVKGVDGWNDWMDWMGWIGRVGKER